MCTYVGFVEGKVPWCKCSCQHTLTESNDEVHDPQPAKEVKNLHAKQVPEEYKIVADHATVSIGTIVFKQKAAYGKHHTAGSTSYDSCYLF